MWDSKKIRRTTQLERASNVIHKEIEESGKKYKESSRQRLLNILEKKFQTSFIGDIARFERFFGRIWGHGKRKEDCTPNELKWLELWTACRSEILDNGNAQIRAIRVELPQYDITWNRYSYKFNSENKDGGK